MAWVSDVASQVKGNPIKIPSEDSSVLVLEFWATWCGPCVQTVPHLTELQHRYKDRGVTIIGISTEDDISKVKRFVEARGSQMDYTVALDAGGAATHSLLLEANVAGIPHAMVVDRTGTITYSGHPFDPQFETKLKAAADTPAKEKVVLPPVTASFDELMGMSVKELKTILSDRGVSTAGAVEKSDLAKLIIEKCSNVTYYK